MVNGFGGISIGLQGLAMVFKGSQPLAKSFVSEGFNGWMATIGANGMTLVFGETTIGLDGMALVFKGSQPLHLPNDPLYLMVLMVEKQPLVPMEWHCFMERQPLDLVEWRWFSRVDNHCMVKRSIGQVYNHHVSLMY